jgi:hypothetical protein
LKKSDKVLIEKKKREILPELKLWKTLGTNSRPGRGELSTGDKT